jgi:hypothetical protein
VRVRKKSQKKEKEKEKQLIEWEEDEPKICELLVQAGEPSLHVPHFVDEERHQALQRLHALCTHVPAHRTTTGESTDVVHNATSYCVPLRSSQVCPEVPPLLSAGAMVWKGAMGMKGNAGAK